MKRVVWLLVAAALLMIVGCAEQKPAEAARQIVDQQVAVHHEGFELDTSKIKYRVVEQDERTATVEVSGNIAVKAVIPLAKKDGEWVLDVPAAGAPEKAAAAH